MNLLDFLLIVILGYSVITGFASGFARVGIGFAAMLTGILCGFWFYGIPGHFFFSYFQSRTAANLLGFFVVFSAVVLAGGIIARLISAAFKWVGLSWLDRFLGAGFGFVRGMVLAVAVVTIITAFAPNPPPRFIVDAKTMPYALKAGSVMAAVAPHELKQSYRDSRDTLNRMWDGVKPQSRPEKLRSQTL